MRSFKTQTRFQLSVFPLTILSLSIYILSEAAFSISVLFILANTVGFRFKNPVGFNQGSGYVFSEFGHLFSSFAESQHDANPLWPAHRMSERKKNLKDTQILESLIIRCLQSAAQLTSWLDWRSPCSMLCLIQNHTSLFRWNLRTEISSITIKHTTSVLHFQVSTEVAEGDRL